MRLRSILLALLLVALSTSAFAQKAFVYVDPVDVTQLRTECTTNPNNYSWTEGGVTQTLTQWYQAGADAIVANILNATRANITIYRTDVRPQEVVEAIALNQLTTTAQAATASLQSAWLQGFFRLDTVRLLSKNGSDTRVLSNLLLILTNGSASETRLRGLGSRTGTRAEQLWGCSTNNDPGCEYVSVQTSHVTQARNLP